MEPGPKWLAIVVGVPALVALVIAGGFALPWSSPSRFRLELGWILALILGTLAGVFAAGFGPSTLWHDSGPYLAFVLPILGIAAVLFAWPKTPRKIAWSLRVLAVVAMAPLMLGFMWKNGTWAWPWETLAWLAGLGVAAALITLATALLAERSPGRSIPFSIGLICAFTGATIVMTGGISFGSMALSLGASIAGGLLATLKIPKVISCRGSAPLGVAALMGLLILTRFTQLDTPPLSLFLLALSPLTLWVSQVPAISRLRPWQIVAVRMTAVLIPLIWAVTPVTIVFVKSVQNGDY